MKNDIKCYHVSLIKNRESILKSGLMPTSKKGGSITYDSRIFFSTDKENLGLDYVDFFNVDVWEFSLDKNLIKKDEFASGECFFYTNKKVSASKIKLMKTII